MSRTANGSLAANMSLSFENRADSAAPQHDSCKSCLCALLHSFLCSCRQHSAAMVPFICIRSLVCLHPPTMRLFFSDQYGIQSKDRRWHSLWKKRSKFLQIRSGGRHQKRFISGAKKWSISEGKESSCLQKLKKSLWWSKMFLFIPLLFPDILENEWKCSPVASGVAHTAVTRQLFPLKQSSHGYR